MAGGTPIFEPQNVNLGADIEAQSAELAQQAGSNFASAADTVSKTISRSNLFNAEAQFQGTVNKSQGAIVASPDAATIATQQGLIDTNRNTILNGTPLRPEDAALLDRTTQSGADNFNLMAARINAENSRRIQQVSFVSGLPAQMQAIQTSVLSGDLTTAKGVSDNLENQSKSLADQGIISAASLNTIQQQSQGVIQRAQMFQPLLSQYGSPGAANASQLATNGTLPEGIPTVTPGIQAHIDSTSQGLALSDAKKECLNNTIPYSFAVQTTSDSAAQHALYYCQGALQTNGTVAAGINYNNLIGLQKNLNETPLLNPIQEGVKDAAKQQLDLIKNNYFQYYTNNTASGKQALANMSQDVAAAGSSSGTLTPQEQQQSIDDAQSKFAQNAITYGVKTGVPESYIKPFSQNDPRVSSVQNAFSPGSDIYAGLTTLKNSGRLAPYISSSLATPTQQEASHLATIAPEKNPQSLDGGYLFIAGTQAQSGATNISGTGSSAEVIGKNSVYEPLLSDPNVKNYMDFVKMQPGGSTRVAAIQKVLFGGVQQCLASSKNSLEDCVTQISNNVPPSNAYVHGTAANEEKGFSYEGQYQFLNSEISNTLGRPMSNADAKTVASYALDQAKQYLTQSYQKSNPTMSASQVESQINSQFLVNPPLVTNTPAGNVIAYDGLSGKVYYRDVLDDSVLGAAKGYARNSKSFSVTKGTL